MSPRKPPTEQCQRPDRCPYGGIPVSGGCKGLQADTAAVTARRNFTKDRRSTHELDATLKGMIRRCEKNPSYRRAGITVHPEWVRNPWAFFNYIDDEMPRPSDAYVTTGGRCVRRYTLDRVNNDRDYEPGNLRWLDRADQNRNRGHEAEALERGFERWAACLCSWATRQDCPCADAVAYRAGAIARNDEIEPWPPGADFSDADARRKPIGPQLVLGQIVGEVEPNRFGELRFVSVEHIKFPEDQWRPVPEPEPEEWLLALLPEDRVDLSDLLGDVDRPSVSDLLDGSDDG